MSDTLRLTIPVPPSLNNAYATVRGRRVLSSEGKTFKEAAALWAQIGARRQRFKVEKGDRLSLTMLLHFKDGRRRDISNAVKLAEDAIAEALGFDDCAVDILHVERKENDRERPRCEVRLEVLSQPPPCAG